MNLQRTPLSLKKEKRRHQSEFNLSSRHHQADPGLVGSKLGQREYTRQNGHTWVVDSYALRIGLGLLVNS
jgi:hypothetical protein